jgi:Zn ribbon nucleic-acid-binding protein
MSDERCPHEDHWTLTTLRESGWRMYECETCGASWQEADETKDRV